MPDSCTLIAILNNFARILKPRGERNMSGDTRPKMRRWKIDKDFVACAGYGSVVWYLDEIKRYWGVN